MKEREMIWIRKSFYLVKKEIPGHPLKSGDCLGLHFQDNLVRQLRNEDGVRSLCVNGCFRGTKEAQTMKDSNIVVNLPKNSDDHPVAMLVQIASRFQSRIYMSEGSRRVNAKSIMGMMALGLNNGSELYVSAEGEDEDAAFTAISDYLLGEAI